jgi:hypothetical protein
MGGDERCAIVGRKFAERETYRLFEVDGGIWIDVVIACGLDVDGRPDNRFS